MSLGDFFKNVFHKETPSALATASDNPTQTGLSITEEERKRVALIATAIAAGDQPSSQYKVVNVRKTKERVGLPISFAERERVAAISAAILANDQPTSQFRLMRLTKIK